MRKRSKAKAQKFDVNLTPMIDVVFQLLIFFIVTRETEDLLTNLGIKNPKGDPTVTVPVTDPIKINVTEAGVYRVNGRQLTLDQLEPMMQSLTDLGSQPTIMIDCHVRSKHEKLITLLNFCERMELENIALLNRK